MKKRIDFDGTRTGGAVPVWFEYDSPDGELRDGQFGVGEVRYAEGSVYRGTLVYAKGRLSKYGYGVQDFTHSVFSAEGLGAPKELKPYKFVGVYDYTVNDWIYGNGVMYFTDKAGAPAAYAPGYYAGEVLRGRYRGAFKKQILLPGFESAKRIGLFPRLARFEQAGEKARKKKRAKTVMIGDSWFEFYEYGAEGCDKGSFEEDSAGKDVINLGIGGTTYYDWDIHVKNVLAGLEFQNVFINLGFNDLHGGYTVAKTFALCRSVVKKLLELNKHAHIYINAVCPSPSSPHTLNSERELNKRVREYCKTLNATYIPCDAPLAAAMDRSALPELFAYDMIHLNSRGYALWAPEFVKYWE